MTVVARALDKLLPPADQTRIVAAIKTAEHKTSGEIKVHVEGRCPGGVPLDRARTLFTKLGMTATRDRNGVLLYVATGDRCFSILGDRGIHEEVGSQFWAEAVSRMSEAFKRGAFGDGLCGAIESIGERLGQRFPRHAGDQNQLPDDISTDENAK